MTTNQEASAQLKKRVLAMMTALETSSHVVPLSLLRDRRIVKPSPFAHLKMHWNKLFKTTRG